MQSAHNLRTINTHAIVINKNENTEEKNKNNLKWGKKGIHLVHFQMTSHHGDNEVLFSPSWTEVAHNKNTHRESADADDHNMQHRQTCSLFFTFLVQLSWNVFLQKKKKMLTHLKDGCLSAEICSQMRRGNYACVKPRSIVNNDRGDLECNTKSSGEGGGGNMRERG